MADVYMHKLPADQKRIFWEGIKVKRPELAKMLNEDEFLKGLQTRFGAMIFFKQKEADEIYKAGIKAVADKKK